MCFSKTQGERKYSSSMQNVLYITAPKLPKLRPQSRRKKIMVIGIQDQL
jgi:hypothetical protein